MRPLAVLLLCSCNVAVDLEQKECAAMPPFCLQGYACVGGLCVKGGGTGGGTGGSTAGGAGGGDGGGSAGGTSGGVAGGTSGGAGGGTAGGATSGGAGGGSAGGTAGGGMSGGMGGGTAGGVSDGGCPFEVDPAANSCAASTYYLSPTGSDMQDGGTPATARLTLTGVTLRRGDVVHLLGGTYAQAPVLGTASGNASCPLLLRGESDGGSILTAKLNIDSSYTVVRYLTLSPQNSDGISLGDVDHVTLQFVKLALPTPAMGFFPVAVKRDGLCTDCTVRESTFANQDGITHIDGTDPLRFVVRGNRFILNRYGEGIAVAGPGGVVLANDFTGTYTNNDGVINAMGAPGAVIARNVFHDIFAFFPDKPLVRGGRVSHNTFASITGNMEPLVLSPDRFDSNLVVDSDIILSTPPPGAGDYNIFDPSVTYAYLDAGALSGTDRVAPVLFQGSTWIPAAGSAAIDSANPADPVPPGGGTRADVGALERGATLLSSGRYCFPDGGL